MIQAQHANPYLKWIYSSHYTGIKNLPDPRIAIARHLQWHRSTIPTTEYTVPEPENFIRAIWTEQPQDLAWAKHQVIYKNLYGPGWFACFFFVNNDATEFDDWIKTQDITYWRHLKPPMIRRQRPWLTKGARVAEMSLDERLLTMGYYKNLVIKYFDGDALYVKSRLGEARANLINLINDD